MTEHLLQLLRELEQFGLGNDKVFSDRPRRMLNITHDTGEFLSNTCTVPVGNGEFLATRISS